MSTKLLLFFLGFLAVAVYAQPVGAESMQAQNSARGDSADVYETKRYPYLTFPRFLWNGLVWPLGQFTIYSEHTELPQRVYNFFTNECT